MTSCSLYLQELLADGLRLLAFSRRSDEGKSSGDVVACAFPEASEEGVQERRTSRELMSGVLRWVDKLGYSGSSSSPKRLTWLPSLQPNCATLINH